MLRVACRRSPTLTAVALRAVSVAATASKAAPLHIVFGAANLPHPEKLVKGGEDAFFADDASGTFGVADGVGGSASDGVDPGLFSREMVRQCHSALSSQETPLRDALSVVGGELGSRQPPLGGSSTLLIGQLDAESHLLHMLNLGDSGAMLFRPSTRRFQAGTFRWPRCVLRTCDQTHYFNCPYQAATSQFKQAFQQADEVSALARDGDIIVAATDGVLDNLFEAQIQMAVAQRVGELCASDPSTAQAAVDDLALAIANEASAIGHREDEEGLPTPFQQAAAQEGYRFLGGKLDDIAVVVGLVRHGERPPKRMLKNFE